VKYNYYILLLFVFLRISTDHNEDDTESVLKTWIDAMKPLYHNINLTIGESSRTSAVYLKF